MLFLFIYLFNWFITEMLFSSSQELEFHISFIYLLENLGPALGIFESINLARWIFKKKLIIRNSWKGSMGTKLFLIHLEWVCGASFSKI